MAQQAAQQVAQQVAQAGREAARGTETAVNPERAEPADPQSQVELVTRGRLAAYLRFRGVIEFEPGPGDVAVFLDTERRLRLRIAGPAEHLASPADVAAASLLLAKRAPDVVASIISYAQRHNLGPSGYAPGHDPDAFALDAIRAALEGRLYDLLEASLPGTLALDPVLHGRLIVEFNQLRTAWVNATANLVDMYEALMDDGHVSGAAFFDTPAWDMMLDQAAGSVATATPTSTPVSAADPAPDAVLDPEELVRVALGATPLEENAPAAAAAAESPVGTPAGSVAPALPLPVKSVAPVIEEPPTNTLSALVAAAPPPATVVDFDVPLGSGNATQIPISDLVLNGFITVDTVLVPADPQHRNTASPAVVKENGLEVNGRLYAKLSPAATASLGKSASGWTYWMVAQTGERLDSVRDRYRERFNLYADGPR